MSRHAAWAASMLLQALGVGLVLSLYLHGPAWLCRWAALVWTLPGGVVGVLLPFGWSLLVGSIANVIGWYALLRWAETVPRRMLADGGLTAASVVLLPSYDPQLLWHGERSRNATCDNVYVALNGEVANELDAALRADASPRCEGKDPAAIARCIVTEHVDEDNPLDKKQHAYTLGIPDACQVQLAPLSTNGITFAQRPHVGAATRTFSIRVD